MSSVEQDPQRAAPESIAGIPICCAGFDLAAVGLDPAGSHLSTRWRGEDGTSVDVVLVAASSPERVLVRGRHCAAWYAGESPPRDRRRDGKALVEALAARVDAALSNPGAGPFPWGLGWRSGLPSRPGAGARGVRALLPELAPGARLGAWRLEALHETQRGVTLQFRRGGSAAERVELEVRSGDDPCGAYAWTPRLAVVRRRLAAYDAPDDLPSQLVALLLVLRDRPSLESRGPGCSVTSDPSPSRPLMVTDPDHRSEIELLRPGLLAAGRYFGGSARVEPLPGGSAEAYAITFPRIPPALDTGPTFFQVLGNAFAGPAVRDYVAQLGYGWDRAGLMRRVPTPRSLRLLLEARGLGGGGFAYRLEPQDEFRVTLPAWLSSYLEGRIAINVGTPRFYRRLAPLLALRAPNRFWCEHLTAVGHDMSVHVLATHRAPRSELAGLARPIAAAAAACRRARRDDALVPLVLFYEEDLVRHCQRLWAEIEDPAQFEDAYATHRDALDAARERAVAESARLRSTRRPWRARLELVTSSAGLFWSGAGDAARFVRHRLRSGAAVDRAT
jgi:hypothetical protein